MSISLIFHLTFQNAHILLLHKIVLKFKLQIKSVRYDTIKPLEENIGKTLWHKLYQCFLRSVSQGNRNKSKNRQMESNQTYKLLYSKGNHKENEKTTYWQKKNICKGWNRQGLKIMTTLNWIRMWNNRTLIHCWWKCKMVQTFWNMVWNLLGKISILLPCNPATELLGIYFKGGENLFLPRNLYWDVYSRFTHNNQNLDATKMSFGKWMDKWTVVHPNNGILFSTKNKSVVKP